MSLRVQPAFGALTTTPIKAVAMPRFGSLPSQGVPRILRDNDMGYYITPYRMQYKHQWLWDAGYHALVLSQFGDFAGARKELESICSVQAEDGLIPHIHFNPDETLGYRPNAADWGTGRPASGITQPPNLATGLRAYYENSHDLDFVKQIFPKLLAYHQWLKNDREIDDNGLIAIVHPWEAGTDNSPIYDGLREKLLKERFSQATFPKRVDTQNIPAHQRPKDDDYKVYWGLISLFQQTGWDQKKMAQVSPFAVADPLMNTWWVKGNEDLAYLAKALGDDETAKTLQGWANETRSTMRKTMWDKKDGIFYAYDFRAHEKIKIKTANSLVPLYAKIPTRWQALRLTFQHLRNPNEFWAPAGIRTTSKNESAYDSQRYWRGPVWMNIQWMLAHGLRQYGFDHLADTLVSKSEALFRQSGYREYYDPDTGAGLGAPEFSWSALVHVMPHRH